MQATASRPATRATIAFGNRPVSTEVQTSNRSPVATDQAGGTFTLIEQVDQWSRIAHWLLDLDRVGLQQPVGFLRAIFTILQIVPGPTQPRYRPRVACPPLSNRGLYRPPLVQSPAPPYPIPNLAPETCCAVTFNSKFPSMG